MGIFLFIIAGIFALTFCAGLLFIVTSESGDRYAFDVDMIGYSGYFSSWYLVEETYKSLESFYSIPRVLLTVLWSIIGYTFIFAFLLGTFRWLVWVFVKRESLLNDY